MCVSIQAGDFAPCLLFILLTCYCWSYSIDSYSVFVC
nr:MAG TPA: hypothetical protein [Caudoviricetes sp.]